MYAIPKHAAESAGKVKSRPIHNQRDIELWWRLELPATRSQHLQTTFAAMKADEMWVACECTGDRDNPPLFAPVKTHSGSMSLRRMKNRAAHKPGCLFEFDEPKQICEPIGTKPEVRGGNDEPRTPPDFLEREQDMRSGMPPDEDTDFEPSMDRSRGPGPLASQLLCLLHKSEMQRWPKPASSPAQMLLTAAREIGLSQTGMHLSDILFCKDKAWTEKWYESAFEKCKRARVQRQAVLVCPVVQASRAESWVQFGPGSDKVQVRGRIAIWGDDAAQVRFPMLMYAKILATPGEPARIAKAYLHPIYSANHWMLVDSNYERDALETIIDAFAALERKGITCCVEKPVYNWEETDARPDFVLTARRGLANHSLLVETMGTDGADYVARKKETLTKLNEYKVFQDFRYRAAPNPDEMLKRYVIGYLQAQVGPSQGQA